MFFKKKKHNALNKRLLLVALVVGLVFGGMHFMNSASEVGASAGTAAATNNIQLNWENTGEEVSNDNHFEYYTLGYNNTTGTLSVDLNDDATADTTNFYQRTVTNFVGEAVKPSMAIDDGAIYVTAVSGNTSDYVVEPQNDSSLSGAASAVTDFMFTIDDKDTSTNLNQISEVTVEKTVTGDALVTCSTESVVTAKDAAYTEVRVSCDDGGTKFNHKFHLSDGTAPIATKATFSVDMMYGQLQELRKVKVADKDNFIGFSYEEEAKAFALPITCTYSSFVETCDKKHKTADKTSIVMKDEFKSTNWKKITFEATLQITE